MQQSCMHGGKGAACCTLWLLGPPSARAAVWGVLWLSGRLAAQRQVRNRPVWLLWHWVCHEHFEKFPLSAGSLSASRGQSGHSERLSGNWHTAGMMMRYAKVGKSEKQCLFQWELFTYSYCTITPWPGCNSDWLVFPLIYLSNSVIFCEAHLLAILPTSHKKRSFWTLRHENRLKKGSDGFST